MRLMWLFIIIFMLHANIDRTLSTIIVGRVLPVFNISTTLVLLNVPPEVDSR